MASITMPLKELDTRAGKIIEVSRRRQTRNEQKAEVARIRSLAFSYAPILPDLYLLGSQMDGIIRFFISTSFDNASANDIKASIHQLSQATGRVSSLVRRFETIGVSNALIYRSLLERISKKNDRMESILEGLQMAVSPEFGEMITHAAHELHKGNDSSARSVPVGQM